MDVQMPKIDGIKVTQKIKPVADMKDTPIVALTALAMPGDRERCIEAGALDYFEKHVDWKQLLIRLAEILDENSDH